VFCYDLCSICLIIKRNLFRKEDTLGPAIYGSCGGSTLGIVRVVHEIHTAMELAKHMAGLGIRKCPTNCILCEGHAQELIEAWKFPRAVVAAIAMDALIDAMLGNEVHDLRENNVVDIHQPALHKGECTKKAVVYGRLGIKNNHFPFFLATFYI
jgi:hypothetical protein